jgi:hypothetical protein
VAQCRQIERDTVKNDEQRVAFQASRDAFPEGRDAMQWVRTESRKSRRKTKNTRRDVDKRGGGAANLPEDNSIAMSSHK